MAKGMQFVNYAESLQGDVRERYINKIDVIGFDPYQFPFESQKKEKYMEWPDLSYVDILNYLVFETSSYTKEQLRNYKSLEAYRYFIDGWVKEIYHTRVNARHVMLGTVNHSMRLNEKPLKPWVIIKDDGVVESAHCTCMAGLGETCSHVGAILFKLETATKIKQESTCTDVPAYWNGVSKSEKPYQRISEIDFTSASKRKHILNSSFSEPSEPIKKKKQINPPTKEKQVAFFDQLAQVYPKAAILSVTPGYSSTFVTPSRQYPREMIYLYDVNRSLNTFDDKLFFCDYVDLSFSKEQAVNVEKDTQKQAQCDLWFRMRAGRITSSNIYYVVKTSLENPSISLIKKICYIDRRGLNTDATNYGKKNEFFAKKSYFKYNVQKHENFDMQQVGFCMNTDFPAFGASPDGLVDCKCCGKGCIEIKCPYSLRLSTEINPPFLEIDENGVKRLKKTHMYFYQVQFHLLITGLSYCDFIVWAPFSELFVERVYKEKQVQEEIVKKASIFHSNVVMPELCFKHFTEQRKVELSTINEIKRTDIDVKEVTIGATNDGGLLSVNVDENNNDASLQLHVYCFCRKPDDGSKMILCENNNCRIKWFHVDCLKLKHIPRKEWFCLDCQS